MLEMFDKAKYSFITNEGNISSEIAFCYGKLYLDCESP